MKKILTLLPVLMACTATPALAQDRGVTGRVELRAGYDELRSALTVYNEAFTENFGQNGTLYGVEAGVDFNIVPGLVAGGYAGLDFSTIDGCQTAVIFVEPDDEACIKVNNGVNSITAGARLGIPTGSGLIYIKGGFSTTKFSASYFDGEDDYFSGTDTVGGWHVGAGLELDVARNFYVKGEYVYHSYGDAFEDDLPGATDRMNPHRHQLIAGVGIRFGGSSAAPIVEAAPPPPPPPAAEAPATQTCPDGSVILATDACPPPPPPPAPAPGERG